MGEDDERRLQRERDIAKAVRGPDTSQRDEAVRRVKAEYQRRLRSSSEKHARERAGYYLAASQGEIPRIGGDIPPFRPNMA